MSFGCEVENRILSNGLINATFSICKFQRTRALVFPNGRAQEREIAFVSFLNQYGPALVERLLAELPLSPGTHWVIAI